MFGSIAIVLGLALALVGGTLFAQQQQDAIGLGGGELEGDGYAVVSDSLDWSTATYLGSPIDRATFEATGSSTGPLFLGLTTPEEAEAYFPEGGRSVDDGQRFLYTEHAGPLPRTDPRDVGIWTASAEGAGTVELEFASREQEGERVLVLMRTDGEALGPSSVTSSSAVPSLAPTALALLGGGVLVSAGGVLLVVLPLRRVRAIKRSAGDR